MRTNKQFHAITSPQGQESPREGTYPGALIVVEGIDGSGKSTQLYLLKRWLQFGGYLVNLTQFNSSPLVKSATKRGKKDRLLTPTTYSLLHASDFADRCDRQILPLLYSGYLVLSDRYIYTAFACDAARGCDEAWLRNLLSFAPVPDITFYFRTPLDVAVRRILGARPKLKYYEAGMDRGFSMNRAESFRIFQGLIMDNYERAIERDNFVLMDGTAPVNELQKQMRKRVRDLVAEREAELLGRLEGKWSKERPGELLIRVRWVAEKLSLRAADHPGKEEEPETQKGVEIERKFLLKELPLLVKELESEEIEQGWLPNQVLQERVRRSESPKGEKYFRTFKAGMELKRVELEEEIPRDVFTVLWRLTKGRRVRKRRYRVQEESLLWEIDSFRDRDLVLAEVEIPKETTKVKLPGWLRRALVREVTGEPEFYNVNLAN